MVLSNRLNIFKLRFIYDPYLHQIPLLTTGVFVFNESKDESIDKKRLPLD